MDDSEAPLSHRTAIFSQLDSICCPDQLRHGTTFSVMAAATCATPGHSGIMRATSFALGLSRTCTVHCTPKLAHEHDITAPNNHHFYCAVVRRGVARVGEFNGRRDEGLAMLSRGMPALQNQRFTAGYSGQYRYMYLSVYKHVPISM